LFLIFIEQHISVFKILNRDIFAPLCGCIYRVRTLVGFSSQLAADCANDFTDLFAEQGIYTDCRNGNKGVFDNIKIKKNIL